MKNFYLLPFVLVALEVAVCCNLLITGATCIIIALLTKCMHAVVKEGTVNPLDAQEIGAALLGLVSSILFFFTQRGSIEGVVCICGISYFWLILIDTVVIRQKKKLTV